MQPDAENLNHVHADFMAAFAQNWPESRLQPLVLGFLRSACEDARERRLEAELENRDARVRGESYHERQKYAARIRAMERVFKTLRARGIEYAKACPPLSRFVKPRDMPYVQEFGLEAHIQSVVLWVQ